MAKNKEMVVASSVERKQYSYVKGGVSLSFTLRNDTTTEMIVWLELMARAKTDIEAEIEKVRASRRGV